MYRLKITFALLLVYSLLCPIFGVGLVRTDSGHLLLSSTYLFGFEIGIVLMVISGFYTLYRYNEAEKQGERTQQLKQAA
ncbi:MAG: hypothetical protein AABZ60_15660 [Planctomycetota bacterium]